MDRILAIESAMDVTSIRYKGLHLWPYVRMQLWQRLMHPNKYAPPATIGLSHLAKRLSQSFFKPEFYMPYLAHSRRHRENLSRLTQYGSVDILFFSRQEDHIDQIGTRFYNRHIDPMTELVKTKYTYLKLELQTEKTSLSLPRVEYTHFYDALEYLRCDAQRSLIAAFQKNTGDLLIEEGKTLTTLLAKTRFDLALTEEFLMLEGERILHYIRYFKELLTALQPKAVFFTRYNDEVTMGLCAACSSLGIATVDIQHGIQGPNQGMYGAWQHIPKGGYALLPDYFWCWGQPAVDAIHEGFARVEGAPRPVLGGHRWMAKWIEHDAENFHVSREIQAYSKSLTDHEQVILVTLPEGETGIPDILLEAMRKAPLDWHWLLRLHPDEKHHVSELEMLLRHLRIQNANVAEATRQPLYALLKNVHRHISMWSAVSYEALRFGVPSLLIHKAGWVLSADYVEKGYFDTADTAEEIIDWLSVPSSIYPEETPYVNTDRTYALDALLEIMSPKPSPLILA